jgi:hypothetical protein
MLRDRRVVDPDQNRDSGLAESSCLRRMVVDETLSTTVGDASVF